MKQPHEAYGCAPAALHGASQWLGLSGCGAAMCLLTESPASQSQVKSKASRAECNHRNKSSGSVAGCLSSLMIEVPDSSLPNTDAAAINMDDGAFREDSESGLLRGRRHSGFNYQVKSVWEDARKRSTDNVRKEKEEERHVEAQVKKNLENLAADAAAKAQEAKLKSREVAVFNRMVISGRKGGRDTRGKRENGSQEYVWGNCVDRKKMDTQEYSSALREQIALRQEWKVQDGERERERDVLQVAAKHRSLVNDIKTAKMGEILRKKQWKNELDKQINDKRHPGRIGRVNS